MFFPNILILELHGRLLKHNDYVPHMKTQTTRTVKYILAATENVLTRQAMHV